MIPTVIEQSGQGERAFDIYLPKVVYTALSGGSQLQSKLAPSSDARIAAIMLTNVMLGTNTLDIHAAYFRDLDWNKFGIFYIHADA